MKKIHRVLLPLLLAVSVFLIFKPIFFAQSVAKGDAPFFYSEALSELVTEPPSWTHRGGVLGGVNQFLWISPLMLVYGLLDSTLGMQSDMILRILFYIPSLVLSIFGARFLAKKMGLSALVQFFAAAFAVLNTYYILLIDGGQVGIALAYGLFPWVVAAIIDLTLNKKKISLVTLLSVILLLADPRVLVLAVVTGIVLLFLEKKITKKTLISLAILITVVISVSLYWLLPLKVTEASSLAPSQLQLTSLLNGLLLYQPHWSGNEYGNVSPPPFYFVIIPLIILAGASDTKKRKISLIIAFLLFIFLLKGETPPLGNIYAWLIAKLPLGSAFRDSSKFFIPLMFLGGILYGLGIERLQKWFKSFAPVVGFLFLLAFVYQALLGNLHFVLSGTPVSQDFEKIYQHLKTDSDFFRTVWIPQKNAYSFSVAQKPAIDGQSLIEKRPFAFLNSGGDVFNYINYPEFAKWYELLGIKYVVVDKNPRKAVESEEEAKNRQTVIGLLKNNNKFEKLDWGTSASIFKTKNPKPHIWGVNKMIAVVGNDSVYKKAEDLPGEFDLAKQGFVFFEDGVFDPRLLEKRASQSAVLVLNDKNKTDLAMSFLQKDFVAPDEAIKSEWSLGVPADYLKWKFELLIRNIKFDELFYNRAVAFSTQENEILTFDLDVPVDGTYSLAVRSINHKNEKPLKISLNNQNFEAQAFADTNFHWSTFDKLKLQKGNQKLIIKNEGGTKIVNIVALVPDKDMQDVIKLADVFTKHFETLDLNKDKASFANILSSSQEIALDHSVISETQYSLTPKTEAYWAIFTDAFDPQWRLKKGVEYLPGIPAYSMVNAFYVDPAWREIKIVYKNQENFRWGVYFSLIAILATAVIYLVSE